VSAIAVKSCRPGDRQVILFVWIGLTQAHVLLVRVDLADFRRIGGDEKPQPARGVDLHRLQAGGFAKNSCSSRVVSIPTFIRSISSLSVARSSFC